MTEPNRLRDEASPNSYRGGTGAARAAGGGGAGAGTDGMPAPARGRVRARPRRARSRDVFIVGIVVAILGVPLFFGAGFTSELTGIGLICLGLGIAVTVVAWRLSANAAAIARRAGLEGAAGLVVAPHLAVAWVVAAGLIGFGLLALGIAAGVL